MKVKNKKRLIIFSTLYIVGYLYFCIFGGINYGMKISDNPALDIMIRSSGFPVGVRNLSLVIFIWIILSFFLVLSILWQTDLAGQKLNRTALICFCIIFSDFQDIRIQFYSQKHFSAAFIFQVFQ